MTDGNLACGESYAVYMRLVKDHLAQRFAAHISSTFHPQRVADIIDDLDSVPPLEVTSSKMITLNVANCGNTPNEQVVVCGSNNEAIQAVFPKDATIIMLGAGAQSWLRSSSDLRLKATRHAVRMTSGQVRAWYGMSEFRDG